MSNTNSKRTAVARMNTEALERIIASLPDWQHEKPTPEAPMAGQIHLSGIGQVPVDWIKAELTTRKESA
jgi:hypothetical protein